ncbi:MAG: hypothetical protein LBT56_06545 [Prevotellaceae bacterium]|jgi:hypothetical protein|nr:hypothetical protein [Prevotellaceae bacterium]
MKPINIKTMMLLISFIVFISCDSNKKEDIIDNETKDDVLLSETLNLNVVLSQHGKAKQIAQAPRMLQFLGKEGKYTTFPDGIYVESFSDSLTLESTIAAKFAKMKEGRDEFYTAYDSVVVTNYIQKTKIITDTLYWDRVNSKIYNYCFTKIFFSSGYFDAHNGMWALDDLSDYEIRTIREGDLTVDRQNKTADSTSRNEITFPDTITDMHPQPTPASEQPQTVSPSRRIQNQNTPQRNKARKPIKEPLEPQKIK